MGKDLWIAVATLVGFTVGAGILGLPYVFSKAGFITGALSVIILGILVIFLNLMIGEISLRTKNIHQLSGYTGKYLGNKGKKLMLIFLMLEWYSALIAYTIKIGQLLSELAKPWININPILFSIIVALTGSYMIFKGLKIIEQSEFWMILLTIVLVLIIGIICLPNMNTTNITVFSLRDFWLPFGVVLFAFGGSGAIPEMREELVKKTSLMKKAIIIGTLISLFIYLLFPLFIVGVTGTHTTEEGIIGLGNHFGYKILLLGSLFGILTMFTSFLVIGLALKEMFKFDYYQNNLKSSLITCLIPFISAIIIMLLNINNSFYNIISLSGSILFPLTGMMFILTYWQAIKKGDRKPEYSLKYPKTLGIVIIIMFLIGLLNELARIFLK